VLLGGSGRLCSGRRHWALLQTANLRLITPPSAPGLDSLPDEEAGLALELYRRLGGIHDHPRLRTGAWDLAVEGTDGDVTLIELDEELHFNQYRRETYTTGSLSWGSCLSR
jgi:hypothetical protein